MSLVELALFFASGVLLMVIGSSFVYGGLFGLVKSSSRGW